MTEGGRLYGELRGLVHSQKLLDRQYGYYITAILWRYAMFVAIYVLAFHLPTGLGWTILLALSLGFTNVQIGFIGHDAGHLAIFKNARNNWAIGLLTWSLTLGVSFWYWHDRHTRHHANTNDVGADPDLAGSGLLAFTVEDAASRTGFSRNIARYQAYLWPVVFVFALIFAFLLRIEGWVFTFRRLSGRRQIFEILLMLVNAGLLLFPAVYLGSRWLLILLISQMFTGLYMALIIAPNHKGMPVWAARTQVSFFERQVISSRNVTSHPVWDFIFGGLNYQIEHHLFPTMPRVNFKQAQALIRPFCQKHDLDYEEMNPIASYHEFYRELDRVSQAVS